MAKGKGKKERTQQINARGSEKVAENATENGITRRSK